MANRYWVGGTGNWNTSNTANWSATSGGAGGASVPTSSDIANFTSGSGTGTVTITSTVSCASFYAENFTNIVIAGSNAYALNVSNSFTLGTETDWACAVTINMNGNGNFIATAVLGPSGSNYSTININNASVDLVTDLTAPGVNFNVFGGSFIQNGSSITIADATRAGTFTIVQGGVGTIDLNAPITAKRIFLDITNVVGFGCNTAAFVTRDLEVYLSGARTAGSITLDASAFGETTVLYNDTNASSGAYLQPSTTVVQNTTICTLYSDAKATTSFSALGSSPGSRLTVKSNTTTQRRIYANAGTLQNTDFQYIYASGTIVPWTGTSLGNLGNNTNITFNYSIPSTGSGLFFAGTF